MIEIVGLVIGGLNVLATIGIAVVLNRLRKEGEAIQNTQAVNRQWQEFNLAMMKDVGTYGTLRALEYETGTDEEIRARHVIYYVLNILYDSWKLGQAGSIDPDFAKTTIEGQLRALSGQKAMLCAVLEDPNLYDEKFRKDCLKVLDRCVPVVVAGGVEGVAA